jgi:hypothetical protein
MFINVFTRAHHWPLFWAHMNLVYKFTLYFSEITLILFSHLRLFLSSGLFPSGFPIKSMQRIPWEANSHSACQKISRSVWFSRFITVFTRVHYSSLSWARYIHFAPSLTISLRFILILSSHILLYLLSVLFPSGFTTKILVTSTSCEASHCAVSSSLPPLPPP